jgi:hypothetical protein
MRVGMKITKIISGGQTGADQAALDAAIELGIDHGGWIPRGEAYRGRTSTGEVSLDGDAH